MNQQRYFETVATDEEIGPLSRGPLTTAHLMRWSAAMENWHKIHYDRDFAVNHDKLPDLLINGSLKQQFILTLLKDWASGGWVWKVRFQFRSMNLVNETLTVWAKVIGTSRQESFGLVRLELGIRNDAQLESTPGTALIALPYRDGPAIPYPFVPPKEFVDV